MIFSETTLQDCLTIKLERRGDERGFFARFFCLQEFSEAGYPIEIKQANDSLSAEKGTLRGMHYQIGEASETKIVRCLKGAIYDVVIDLRSSSQTYLKWEGFHLDAENRDMVRVPKGFAHGFLTLEPDTEVFYLVDNEYSPDSERGVRWNDPAFDIDWPLQPQVISDKDDSWADFVP
ncbi:dTDP-4-dehydrorhamnose 3,5-epimerase [Verrucomicrobia bacterium]|nr:dTDP-4-dehydrorhamnose 3,5-epimerase [Verrucomicrobiota bacterium]